MTTMQCVPIMSYWEEAPEETCWTDQISCLAWEHLSVPPDELEEMARERDVWVSPLGLLFPTTQPQVEEEENGWKMDGLIFVGLCII